MPETEQQDRTLSELVVKEAVQMGMDSPLKDSILEGVEESGEAQPSAGRRLPLAGAVFGLGAAAGFLAGREMGEMEETPLEDVQEPEIIEDVVEDVGGEEEEETEEMMEMESEAESEESSSRLPRLLLLLGVVAGAVLLRRRLGEEEEEWEPIEEFEPATDEGEEEEAAEGEDEETAADEDEEAEQTAEDEEE